jgi:hypothetical protein
VDHYGVSSGSAYPRMLDGELHCFVLHPTSNMRYSLTESQLFLLKSAVAMRIFYFYLRSQAILLPSLRVSIILKPLSSYLRLSSRLMRRRISLRSRSRLSMSSEPTTARIVPISSILFSTRGSVHSPITIIMNASAHYLSVNGLDFRRNSSLSNTRRWHTTPIHHLSNPNLKTDQTKWRYIPDNFLQFHRRRITETI